MTAISKDKLNLIRNDMDQAFGALARTHGLKSLRCGNGTYTAGGSFTFKVEGVTMGGANPDVERYALAARLYKLPPLGTEFRSGGRTYKISGFNKGTKVIAARDDGKQFLFHHEDVVRITAATA